MQLILVIYDALIGGKMTWLLDPWFRPVASFSSENISLYGFDNYQQLLFSIRNAYIAF